MGSSGLSLTSLAPELGLTIRGEVAADVAERAVREFGRVLRFRPAAESARVRLTGPPCSHEPLLVQANLNHAGISTRVQIAGDAPAIIDSAARRLEQLLIRLAGGWAPREWPDHTRPPLAILTANRPITRRKVYSPLIGTPQAATAVMDSMDYDVLLFVDEETGEDAVVYWAGPVGVRLSRQYSMHPPASNSVALTINPHTTPQLTEDSAARRLCWYGLPFVFFTDPDSGRGRLLYRRYDGDLALVTSATDTAGIRA